LSPGANSAGLCLAGVLPGAGGQHAGAMLDKSLDAVMLLNVEPDKDLHATRDAVAKLASQAFVIALTPFNSESLRETADLLLPIGTGFETSGTFVNVEGRWQSFAGVANPVGEARPAWKVLRVLGNLTGAPGFEYLSSEEIRDELQAALGDIAPASYAGKAKPGKLNGEDAPEAEIDTPIYSVDSLVRRAKALQLTAAARRAAGESD
jgi:NADH-quinone oxidoreductase subunit G